MNCFTLPQLPALFWLTLQDKLTIRSMTDLPAARAARITPPAVKYFTQINVQLFKDKRNASLKITKVMKWAGGAPVGQVPSSCLYLKLSPK